MNAAARVVMVCVGVSLIVGAAIAATAQRSAGTKLHGDAARGEAIAARWCVSCHVVNGPPLNDQVPSFASIAASDRYEAEIRGFLMQPHPPMPPLALANQEIEDVLAFVRTLTPAAGK